jgi:hypothetical protein
MKYLFCDLNGQLCPIALLQTLVFLVFIMLYSFLSVKSGKFIDIPNDIIMVMGTLLGVNVYSSNIKRKV